MPQTIAAPPRTSALPTGPNSAGWWQLLRFAGDPLRLLDECNQRYGDAFTLNIAGHGRFVMLSDPEVVRDVFRGDPEVLHSGEANALLTATLGRHSVLVLDEAPHARQRRVLVPPLKGERMRVFFDAMRLETLDAARAWPRDAPFPALPTMRRITVRVILRTALGLTPGPEMDRLERKIETFLRNGRQRYALVLMTVIPIDRLSGSRWAPLFRQLRDLDDDLFALIAARRRGEHPPSGENVLDDLLAATHDDGSPLDKQEVRDALFTILIAGHDTTALALAWALADIVPRADVVDRLLDELRRVTGGGPPEADHLPALEYLDAAIRESLRRSPVVPFVVRKTVRPFAAGAWEFPPGVVLCPCAYLVHRRDDLYPEPDQFRPERFLERKFGPHEWFPFGGGNRVCLGMPFALYEMKVVLATLFSQRRFARPAGGSVASAATIRTRPGPRRRGAYRRHGLARLYVSIISRPLLLHPRHAVSRLWKADEHFGVVTRNDQPRARRDLLHPVLRGQVRFRVERLRDRDVLIEILVEINVVRGDDDAARLGIHADVLRRKCVPAPGIDGHSREDFLGVAVDQMNAPLGVEFHERRDVRQLGLRVLAVRRFDRAGVVGVFLLLDPDRRLRKQVNAVGMVPMHVCDNDVGNLLGLDPKLPQRALSGRVWSATDFLSFNNRGR